MRILLIIPKHYGAPWNEGVKCIARRLASYLVSEGHRVLVASTGDGERSEELGEFGEKVYYTTRFEDWHTKHRRVWVRARLWRSMIDLVRRIVDENDPDTVMLFASASLFLGPRVSLLKSIVGSRLVLYVTGLNKPTFGAGWLISDVKVMVGSPFLLRWFPNATVVHPVTPIHFQPNMQTNSLLHTQGHLSLLYLGTAQKERGVDYLLKGLMIARDRTRCPLTLTLALNGIGGENHHRVERQIAEMGLDDIVSVKGTVDTIQAYGESDVVVIPRQEPTRMAFPVRILEALSFNRPMIVTSICDMGLLVDGCAVVVDPRNPSDLARAIVNLAEDRCLLRRMSANCASLVQKYDPCNSLETISSVLMEVTRGRRLPNEEII